MIYQDIYNCFVNIQKNEDILSIMSNLQSNCNMAYMASDRLAAN